MNSTRATQFRQWATKVLDIFTKQGYVLDKGKVTAAIAKAFAESESPQYWFIQDQLYQSDFDRLMEAVNRDGNSLHEK